MSYKLWYVRPVCTRYSPTGTKVLVTPVSVSDDLSVSPFVLQPLCIDGNASVYAPHESKPIGD